MTQRNLLDIYDASELDIYIATEYDSTDESWNYEKITYNQEFSPDLPDSGRAVYDGVEYKGDKPDQVERSLTVGEFLKGFDEGLFQYENMDGLLAKVEINPIGEDAPESGEVLYYTNWNTGDAQWSKDDVGDVVVTLEGRISGKTETEPDGTEDWVNESV